MIVLKIRRVSFCVVRKNHRSKEFSRHDDSIPYLDNAKLILFNLGYNEKVGAVKDKQAAAKERKAANKQSQKRYLNFSDNDSSPEIKNKKKR